MFKDTITIFNYHSKSGKWYLTLVDNADVGINKSVSASTVGDQNGDIFTAVIHTDFEQKIGEKRFLKPKEYSVCDNPANFYTFNPKTDFIYCGKYSNLSPNTEDSYVSGLFHELNKRLDDLFSITSYSFYSLIPHFEVTGK